MSAHEGLRRGSQMGVTDGDGVKGEGEVKDGDEGSGLACKSAPPETKPMATGM